MNRRGVVWIALSVLFAAGVGCSSRGAGPAAQRGPVQVVGEGLLLMLAGQNQPLDLAAIKVEHLKAVDALGDELRWTLNSSMKGPLGPFVGIDILGRTSVSPIKVDAEILYKDRKYKLLAVFQEQKIGSLKKWTRVSAAVLPMQQ